jgi:hypothetical protein
MREFELLAGSAPLSVEVCIYDAGESSVGLFIYSKEIIIRHICVKEIFVRVLLWRNAGF